MNEEICRIVTGGEGFDGKQGLSYFSGISAETAGSKSLCMHLLSMPPGARAKAHYHESHETAIYMLSGTAEMLYGDQLQFHRHVSAGDFIYIPAGVAHLPYNPSTTETAHAVISRTDPNEQESVILCPDLETIADQRLAR